MANALRGQASSRFYHAFYIWSKSGCVAHHQRRGFRQEKVIHMGTANKLHENNSALLTQIKETYGTVVQTYGAPPREDKPFTRVRIQGEKDAVLETRQFINTLDGSTADDATTLPIYDTLNTTKPKETGFTLKEDYKAIMRNAPSSVVVLAADVRSARQSPLAEDRPHWYLRGMTISSMNSVTLDPEPIISFSIKNPSRTLDAILDSRILNVHFLRSDERGAQVANAFAKPHEDPIAPFYQLESLGLIEISGDQNTGPKLTGGAVTARFRCVVIPNKTVRIGDHSVVFAKVTHSAQSDYSRGREALRHPYLIYCQGAYRRLAHTKIDPAMLNTAAQQQHASDVNSAVKQAESEVPDFKAPKDEAWLNTDPTTKANEPNEPQEENPNPWALEEEPTRDSQEPAEAATAESMESAKAERDALEKFNEEYFRRAAGEDDLLEERAADQRALGEDVSQPKKRR